MRIGGNKTYQKEHSLYDWVADTGYGIMNVDYYGNVPDEAVLFCEEQFKRFNITVPPKEVIDVGAGVTLSYLDTFAPYSLLCGVSDVEVCEDWMEYAYEVTIDNQKHEANPEKLETFIYVKGQDEVVFNELIAKPGLESLPYGMGQEIEDALFYSFAEGIDSVSNETRKWLERASGGNTEVINAYFKLPAWATFLWIAGPFGREFRTHNHDLFYQAYKEGYAYLYEGVPIASEHVTRLNRQPESCVSCGLSSWCVEMVYLNGVNRHICEKCLNGGIQVFGNANCGSKFCKYTECKHHPNHGKADALYHTLSRNGQLAQIAAKKRLELHGNVARLTN